MSQTPAPSDTHRLAELIVQRHELVQKIHQLTVAHADMASADEASMTLGVLSRKETMLDQLTHLHSLLTPFHSQDPELRTWISLEERQRCQEIANRTDILLREIMELDQRNIDSMQQRREAIAAQLLYGQDSRCAEQAYTAASQLEEGLLDISE
jgi:hypothetical protein